MIKLEDLKCNDTIYMAKKNKVTKFNICKTIHKDIELDEINKIFGSSENNDSNIATISNVVLVYPYFEELGKFTEESGYIPCDTEITRFDEEYLFRDYNKAKEYVKKLYEKSLIDDDCSYLFYKDVHKRRNCSMDRCNDGCEYYYDCWC